MIGGVLVLYTLWSSVLLGLAYGEYENSDLWDPGSSVNQSGVETPREYFLPPPPDYEKVDPKEFQDYHNTYYSPYAQLQIFQPIQVGQTKIKTGYYLVKPDIVEPPPAPIITQEAQPSLLERIGVYEPKQEPPSLSKRKVFPAVNDPAIPPERQAQVCLLLKQEGAIQIAIPVAQSRWQEKSLKKGQSTARLILETGDVLHPTLLSIQYCVRKICYQSVTLTPGLIQ